MAWPRIFQRVGDEIDKNLLVQRAVREDRRQLGPGPNNFPPLNVLLQLAEDALDHGVQIDVGKYEIGFPGV